MSRRSSSSPAGSVGASSADVWGFRYLGSDAVTFTVEARQGAAARRRSCRSRPTTRAPTRSTGGRRRWSPAATSTSMAPNCPRGRRSAARCGSGAAPSRPDGPRDVGVLGRQGRGSPTRQGGAGHPCRGWCVPDAVGRRDRRGVRRGVQEGRRPRFDRRDLDVEVAGRTVEAQRRAGGAVPHRQGRVRLRALAHPEVPLADGKLLVSISRNTTDLARLKQNPEIGRPKFAEITRP